MKKTDKIKEAITKDKEDKEAKDVKNSRNDFYGEFNGQDETGPLSIDLDTLESDEEDEITLRPEEQLSCDITSHLAMLTAARLDDALLETNPIVAKILVKKLEESDAEEMVSMLQAIFLTSGMINASESLDALRFCEKYDSVVYMHFQDELADAEVFDWCRIDDMFAEYYEEKWHNLRKLPVEVTI